MKLRWNKALALLLAVGCAGSAGNLPAVAAQASVEQITDGTEVSQLVQDYWEEDYFEQVIIDPEREQVTADGERATLEQTLGLDTEECQQVMTSAQAAEDYFQDSPYEAEQTQTGTVVVTAPYQTKRLVVNTQTLTSTYGAEETLYNAQLGQYILQYATQEETQAAYERLCEQYGAEQCFVDEIIDGSDLLQTQSEGTDCYSWGASLMGMNTLKEEVEQSSMTATATVAIIDTGVDATHPFFDGGRISKNSYSFASDAVDSTDIADASGHGTHVAGIVADSTPDNVTLLILRIFDRNGKSSSALMASAIQYAVRQQASAINISAGWDKNSATDSIRGILNPAIEDAYEAGVPVVTAAGNQRMDVATTYPACHSQTFAISSVDRAGDFDQRNSNFGAGIDFAAPGVNVVSAQRGGGTCSKTGTSMAAPHIAAAVAYVKLFHPEADVAQVYGTLKQYAVDAGETGKDAWFGWGYVNLAHYAQDEGEQPRSCANWEIQLSQERCVYTGKAIQPSVTVLEKGKPVSDQYYQVTYQNNNAVGVATVVVTGCGKYEGTVKKTFSITLATPTMRSVTNEKDGIRLQWTAVPGASSYQIERKRGDGSWKTVKTIKSGKTTYWTDTKEPNGVRNQYRIKAVYGKVTSARSKAKAITCLTYPKLSTVKNSGKQAVTVSWKKNEKASGYQVQYGQGSQLKDKKSVTISKAKTTKTTVKKLKKGKTYYFRVRSYRTVSGQKEYSAWSAKRAVIVKK